MSGEHIIPSAGPDLAHLLDQDVVIEAGAAVEGTERSGAQRGAVEHHRAQKNASGLHFPITLPPRARNASRNEVRKTFPLRCVAVESWSWVCRILQNFPHRAGR